MVSNAPRVHASDRAPAFAAPPFAMAASRDVVSGASARAVRPPVSARACLEHLCRALASLGVGVVPTEDASRGSRDRPRRALTAETLRRAKFDHPDASAPLWRAIHDLFLVCAAGFPNPSVAADALARVRGDADDVEDATCGGARAPPSRRGWLPPRARPREPPPARRPKPPAPPRARVGGASRGLRPRARRRARAQPRIRRARRFPVPPPRPTRPTAPPHPPPRAPPPRAPSRKSARTSTTRAPPSTRAETNTTPSETPAASSASRSARRRLEPLPLAARAPRGSARRRRATPAFARRRQSSRKDCGRRSRTSRRSNARARLVAFVFENRGANSPRVSAIPPRRPRDRRFLRPRTRCC